MRWPVLVLAVPAALLGLAAFAPGFRTALELEAPHLDVAIVLPMVLLVLGAGTAWWIWQAVPGRGPGQGPRPCAAGLGERLPPRRGAKPPGGTPGARPRDRAEDRRRAGGRRRRSKAPGSPPPASAPCWPRPTGRRCPGRPSPSSPVRCCSAWWPRSTERRRHDLRRRRFSWEQALLIAVLAVPALGALLVAVLPAASGPARPGGRHGLRRGDLPADPGAGVHPHPRLLVVHLLGRQRAAGRALGRATACPGCPPCTSTSTWAWTASRTR